MYVNHQLYNNEYQNLFQVQSRKSFHVLVPEEFVYMKYKLFQNANENSIMKETVVELKDEFRRVVGRNAF